MFKFITIYRYIIKQEERCFIFVISNSLMKKFEWRSGRSKVQLPTFEDLKILFLSIWTWELLLVFFFFFFCGGKLKFFSQNTYMLFAGWEGRIVKNCDRGFENATRGYKPKAAFSSPSKLAVNAANWFTCPLQTIAKNLTSQRASHWDTRQGKIY